MKETLEGQKSIITLLDGTIITLNADSRLRVPKTFTKNKREVFLEGEAFFEVAHDSTSPFIVHSGKFDVTVLGTVFDVKAFPGENKYLVSLVKGKVKVSDNVTGPKRSETILKPDEQFSFNYETSKSNVENFDYLQATGWKDNILIFNNTPLKEVFVQLQRAYGVKFTLQYKKFENFKIKANFQNDSFWTIVKILKAVTGLEYKTAGDSNELKEIIFYKS